VSILSVQKCFSLFLAEVLGGFLTIIVKGVEEDFEDDALTLQKSIRSILMKVFSRPSKPQLRFFFLLKTSFSSAKFTESSSPWYMLLLLVTLPW
jgi:hypothetical protein